MTKLGNATLFGNIGSFVFAAYGLVARASAGPRARQAAALALAASGAALLMSSSYELSARRISPATC